MSYRGGPRQPGPRGPRMGGQNPRQRMSSLMGPPNGGMMQGAPPRMPNIPQMMPGHPPPHFGGPPPPHQPGPQPPMHAGPPIASHSGPPPPRFSMPQPPLGGGPVPLHAGPPPSSPYGGHPPPPQLNRPPNNSALPNLMQDMRALPRFGHHGPPPLPSSSQLGTRPPGVAPTQPPPLHGGIAPLPAGGRPPPGPLIGAGPAGGNFRTPPPQLMSIQDHSMKRPPLLPSGPPMHPHHSQDPVNSGSLLYPSGPSYSGSDYNDDPHSNAPPRPLFSENRNQVDEGLSQTWSQDRSPRGSSWSPRRGNMDRMPNRGPDRGFDRGPDRGPDRGFDRSPDRRQDRGPVRGFDRGPGRGPDRGPDRAFDRGPGRRRDRGPNRGPDGGPDRGPDRGLDRGPDGGPDRGPDRGPNRGPGRGPDKSPNRGPGRGTERGRRRGAERDPSGDRRPRADSARGKAKEEGRYSAGLRREGSPSPGDRRRNDSGRRNPEGGRRRERDRRRDRRRSGGDNERPGQSGKRTRSPSSDTRSGTDKRDDSQSRLKPRRKSPDKVGSDSNTKEGEKTEKQPDDRSRSDSRKPSAERRPAQKRRRDRRREAKSRRGKGGPGREGSRPGNSSAATADDKASNTGAGSDAGSDTAPASPPAWEDMSAESRYEVLSTLLEHEKKDPDDKEDEKADPGPEEVVTHVPAWIRCSPSDLYFRRDRETNCMVATKKMEDLQDRFETELIQRATTIRATKPAYEKPVRPNPALTKHSHLPHHHHAEGEEASSSSSSDDDSDIDNEVAGGWMEELTRKQQHPERLHSELWFNEPGEMNDGPLCRCSLKSKEAGIRHDIYPGETPIPRCIPNSNNQNKLYHYRITMSPHTNFLTKNPTIIEYDNHEYIFEGFSLLSHYKLENVPVCRVIRFNIEYTIHWFEEELPENFSLRSLDLFNDYLFHEILELVDLDWRPKEKSCSRFHLMPRFARDLPDNGKEVLSVNEVLLYLLRSARPLIEETELSELLKYEKHEWQTWVDKVRGMIVSYPGMRPSSIRIDQLDREQQKDDTLVYPMIIHFGIRPAQLSYAGDPNYQKLWKQYVKFKHLLANKPKITLQDKTTLDRKEEQLQEMRMKSSMKREVTVELSSQGFTKTGIKSDMCQHAMLLPVLIVHLRFHKCLDVLETAIQYKFKDRMLLQLALTHPSYRVNFGTNPDHARNSLSNCGIRQPEYGDRRIHHVHTRKRGINTLINIMSRLGRKEETVSEINHYERLEFLGDAVVEFMSSIHLYYMFPSLEEGGLATYRAAIVQNQHLAILAKKLHLHDFMLYAHGPDLCHESDLRHAMANCLEALMGSLFLDGGIELSDRIFGEVLFDDDTDLLYTWQHLPVHPLQEDEPNGDRHWIDSSPALQKLLKFEDMTGTTFTHVRLLARAFTMRNVGYNNLTFGHNQRLEFLGDTVLQLVASEYLFKHFPEHHEGHLSLLRSSLVNNRTQAVVCDDLGMTEYIIHADNRPYDQAGMKHKEKADLLEAFIGGLYVDSDLEYCSVFCHVCFFPRLKQFILNQDWNDPKSQLQQCCLTLRELDGGEPDIPIYKVIASTGPTNTRKYTVAVYFRGERLATGTGHSIQQAEMNAANNALSDRGELFPQLAHQKKFIEKKYKRRRRRSKHDNEPKTSQIRNEIPVK